MPACLRACVPAWCARERILKKKKKKNALRVSPLTLFFSFSKKEELKRKESTKKKYLDHTHGVPLSHIKRAFTHERASNARTREITCRQDRRVSFVELLVCLFVN